MIDTIKAILDRDCLKSVNGQCKEAMIFSGPIDGGYTSHTFCWLCHKNDDLAREIADAVSLISVLKK